MPLWTKNGAGSKPKFLTKKDRRNVIATPLGWVKRDQYTGVGSVARYKEEIIVASRNLANLASMGNPDIAEIYVANSTNGSSLKRNQVNSVRVVFTEPISIGASASPFRLTVANTAGGNTVIATSNTNKLSIMHANNTLVFKFRGPSAAGTYRVQPQNFANTAQAKVYGIYTGAADVANTNISAAISNALGPFTIS